MGRVCHLLDIVIGQDHPRTGLHMRCENHLRLMRLDGFDNVINRAWGKGRGRAVALHLRLHDGGIAGQIAALDDLAPPIGKPAVAHDQHLGPPCELTGDCLHPVGAAPGDDSHGIGLVYVLEQSADVAHDLLEHGAHMVQGPVGEHDRKLFKPFRVN